MRKVLGAVAGVVVAVVTVMLVQWLGHTVFPPPAGLDTADPAALAEYVRNAPLAALVFVIAGYVVATFDGIVAASLVGRGNPAIYTGIVAGLMLAGTIVNLAMIPHPGWFQVAALGGIVLAALAAFLVSRALLGRRGGPP